MSNPGIDTALPSRMSPVPMTAMIRASWQYCTFQRGHLGRDSCSHPKDPTDQTFPPWEVISQVHVAVQALMIPIAFLTRSLPIHESTLSSSILFRLHGNLVSSAPVKPLAAAYFYQSHSLETLSISTFCSRSSGQLARPAWQHQNAGLTSHSR